MMATFQWLDSHPAAFWAGAVLGLGSFSWAVLGVVRTSPGVAPSRVASAWLIGSSLLLLLAWRWPWLFEMSSVGRDEPWLLAGALACQVDPAPFRGADIGTIGLPAAWPLALMHWLGLPQDTFNARLTALLLDGCTLAAIWNLLRCRVPVARAMAFFLPVAVGVSVAGHPALYEYSAGHPGALLLVTALGLLWRPEAALSGSRRRDWIAAGVMLSAIPWLSSQAIFAAAGLWLAVLLASRVSLGRRPEIRRHLLPAGGVALYGLAAAACYLHGIGQWSTFVASYWLAAMSPDPLSFAGFGWSGLAIGGVGLLVGLVRTAGKPGASRWLPIASVGITAVLLVSGIARGAPRMVGQLAETWRHPRSALGQRIRVLRQPGDRLLVWADQPQLYVEAGVPPAVAELGPATMSGREESARVRQRKALLARLARNPPDFVVLSPSGGGRDEAFPELREFVLNYYRFDSGSSGPLELYVRANRGGATVASPQRVEILDLARIRVLHSVVPIQAVADGRWFAHAASSFAYGLPVGAQTLRGVFGFQPAAYTNPAQATDGATFAIDAVTPAGVRVRLFERRLEPATNPGDRGPIDFSCTLPSGQGMQLEFIIDPNGNNNFDWTYWSDLRFEG